MSRLRAAIARVRQLFLGSRLEHEQDEEFAFHMEMQVEHNRRLGMSDADARREALLAFGGRERFREEARDARGVVMLDNLARDLRIALRRLRRAPAFAAGAIGTLGIGIGAAAGIGVIVYGVLLRDLPYRDPDQLVRVSFLTPGLPTSGSPGSEDLFSDAGYIHLASTARSLTHMAAYVAIDAVNIMDGDAPERVIASQVTPNSFPMLDVAPIMGRTFETSDTSWIETAPLIISERLWRRRYGADSSIIGRRIELSLGTRDIIGVMPSAFDYPSAAVDVWYPSRLASGASLTRRYVHSIARLAPGVSVEQAEAELNALIPRISDRFPTITPADVERSGARVVLQPLKAWMVGPVRDRLWLLGIMVVVVLVIATTNVVNLFLLRAEQARQETAISASLGAGALRLAQRFVVEGILIGAASTAIGIPVAALALSTKFGFSPTDIPRLHEISFTFGAGAVIVFVALALGALIGATALTRAQSGNVGDALRGGARTTESLAWRRVQQLLVAGQVAMAVALLACAGLLGRSFINLSNARLGFDPAGATTFSVSLPFNPYAGYPAAAAFHARMADRLRALPGVTSVSTVRRLPLTPTDRAGENFTLNPIGGNPAGVEALGNMADPDYFDAMGIPLYTGRTFAAGDVRASSRAIIVSDHLGRNLFNGQDPVGRLVQRILRPGDPPVTYQIVGVVGDVPGWRIEHGPAPDVYFPLLRDADGLPRDSARMPIAIRNASYVIRGAAPTPATIRSILSELQPGVPAVGIKSLDALVGEATAQVRLTMLLLAVAAAAALILGIVGVYSVVSYSAARRLREFGVRLALGATSGGVARLVLRDGLTLAVTGIVAGVVLALTGARFLRSLLYQVSPTSLTELALAVAVIVAVTLLSTLVPARRAARTDPAVVLRGE